MMNNGKRIKKHDPARVKIKFERKRLFIALAFYALTAVLISIVGALPMSAHYPRQLVGFAAIVTFALASWFVIRLFTVEIRHELYRRLGHVFSGFSLKVRSIVDRVLTKLGIDTSTRVRGHDQREIVFEDQGGKRHGRRRSDRPRRYSDLTTNRERIRHIFAKYITNRKTKDNPLSDSDTPIEMMLRYTALTADEEQELYNAYLEARYTDDTHIIQPEAVLRSYDFVYGKRK